jgi:hypothetical protein
MKIYKPFLVESKGTGFGWNGVRWNYIYTEPAQCDEVMCEEKWHCFV